MRGVAGCLPSVVVFTSGGEFVFLLFVPSVGRQAAGVPLCLPPVGVYLRWVFTFGDGCLGEFRLLMRDFIPLFFFVFHRPLLPCCLLFGATPPNFFRFFLRMWKICCNFATERQRSMLGRCRFFNLHISKNYCTFVQFFEKKCSSVVRFGRENRITYREALQMVSNGA